MVEEFIAAGFGGQGVLLIGQVICLSGIRKNMKATWMPSYGPEMRGGTANCLFVVSDEAIGSPVVSNPTTFFCLNQPSMDKFGGQVKEKGVAIVNSSLVNNISVKESVRVVRIPASDIANEIGSNKIENMIMVGGFIAQNPIISIDEMLDALGTKFGDSQTKMDLNRRALEAGFAWVKRT